MPRMLFPKQFEPLPQPETLETRTEERIDIDFQNVGPQKRSISQSGASAEQSENSRIDVKKHLYGSDEDHADNDISSDPALIDPAPAGK